MLMREPGSVTVPIHFRARARTHTHTLGMLFPLFVSFLLFSFPFSSFSLGERALETVHGSLPPPL